MKRLSLSVLGVVLFLTAYTLTSFAGESSATPATSRVAQENDIPIVQIAAPASGSQVVVGSDVLIRVDAYDSLQVSHISIEQVGVGQLERILAPAYELKALPMLFKWHAEAVGDYTLVFKAYRSTLESVPAELTLSVVASPSEVLNPPMQPVAELPPTDDGACYAMSRVNALPLRVEPTRGAELVTTADMGWTYKVVAQGQSQSWYQVELPSGRLVWMDGLYSYTFGDCSSLGIDAAVSQISPTNTTICRVRILSEVSSLRSDPQQDASILFALPINSEWQITNSQGEWLQLYVDGAIGWVPANEITVKGNCDIFNLALPTPIAVTNNQPPSLQPIPNQSLTAGQSVVVPIQATDPEGTAVNIAAARSGSDAVATVSADDQGNLVVVGVGVGQVNIQVTVMDANGGQATTLFTVKVDPAGTTINQPPSVDLIPNQTIPEGQTITIPVVASDPEGYNVFLGSVTSAADTIVRVGTDNNRNLLVTGISAGEAAVSVIVDDGSGGQTGISFNVTVLSPSAEPVNQLPVVEPLSDVTLLVGGSTTVQVVATDPEGFNPFLAGVTSSADTVAAAAAIGDMKVQIVGASPGTVTVTIVVSDGNGGQTPVTFRVTVNPQPTAIPNQPPVVQPILDQVVGVGQTITVFVSATDPEGFHPFFAEVTSSADTIATAESDGEGNLLLTGVSAGQATITAVVDDSNGGQTAASFNVTVNDIGGQSSQGTQPPQMLPIPPQQVQVNEFLPLAVQASDPDGSPVTLTVISSDESIAAAQVNPTGVMIFGAGVGQAVINLYATDAQGQSTSVVFVVTVVSASNLDLSAVPNQPDLSGEVLNTIAAVYAVTLGQPNNLLLVGDTTPAQVFGDGGAGSLDLSQQPSLEATLGLYANSVQSNQSFANNPAWKVADVLSPDNKADNCQNYDHPLACGIALQQPTLAVVMVGRNDVLAGTSVDQFKASLGVVVDTLTINGVIPVLVTIPGDERVDPYNQAIVQVADERHVPLWNLWASVPAANLNADLTLTAPPTVAGDTLSMEAVGQYGASQRNLELLQVLTSLRQAVPIN